MAHGENAQKYGQAGKEWWGKRPLSGTSAEGRGLKFWKKLLHKKERNEGKSQINNQE